MAKSLHEQFKLTRETCATDQCGALAAWRLLFTLYAPCNEKDCHMPHFSTPAVLMQDVGYCDACKKNLKFEEILSDKIWAAFEKGFIDCGLKQPQRDWTLVGFHKIPEPNANVVAFPRPKIVSNPEPETPPPPAAS